MTAELLPCPFCGGEAGYYASNEAVFGASWIGHVCHCKVCQGRVQTTAGMDASVAMWNARAAIQPQRMREAAAEAIRTFCKSLGNNVVVVSSDDVERIYYSGISVDALSAAIAIALTRPELSPTENKGE